MAATVVPWVISWGDTPRGSVPQLGSPPARRRTARKDGPGSSSARKVGNVIGAEATGSPRLRRPGAGYAFAHIRERGTGASPSSSWGSARQVRRSVRQRDVGESRVY